MDIFSRLKTDHDRMRSMIKEIKETSDRAKCGQLYQTMHDEVIAHSLVEEKVLYQSLTGSEDAGEKAMEGWNEHHLIEGLLEELILMSPDSAGWKAKFQVLGELLEHHIEEEEEELFEEARKTLDDSRAKTLGQEFDRRKGQMLDALSPLAQAAE